jgi:hypothetical protein
VGINKKRTVVMRPKTHQFSEFLINASLFGI